MNSDQFLASPDNFYPLVPLGMSRMNSKALVIGDGALRALLQNFKDQSEGENFPGILVDFNHSSNDPDQPTEAAGWITAIEPSNGWLMCLIQWSDKGREAVASGDFRFLSPVFNALSKDDVIVPHHLESVGLTNQPLTESPPLIDDDGNDEPEMENRLRGDAMLISNRSDEELQRRDIAASIINENWVQTRLGTYNNWLELCRLLDLDGETSTPDDIKSALAKRHAPRIARRRRTPEEERAVLTRREGFSNSGHFHNRPKTTKNMNMRNRDSIANSIAHMIRARMNNGGSSIRGYSQNEKPGTRDEKFAGPTRYAAESIYREKPKARLNWQQHWSSGFPQFDSERDMENSKKMDALAERIAKRCQSVQALRSVAANYAYKGDDGMRYRLHKLADMRDQQQRARRENRMPNRFRPLGAPTLD